MNPRFISRLARSTKLSKINHELRLSGSFSTSDGSASADLSSKLVGLYLASARPRAEAQGYLSHQALETNLLTLARLVAACQLASHATVDFFGTGAALGSWPLALPIMPTIQARVAQPPSAVQPLALLLSEFLWHRPGPPTRALFRVMAEGALACAPWRLAFAAWPPAATRTSFAHPVSGLNAEC